MGGDAYDKNAWNSGKTDTDILTISDSVFFISFYDILFSIC